MNNIKNKIIETSSIYDSDSNSDNDNDENNTINNTAETDEEIKAKAKKAKREWLNKKHRMVERMKLIPRREYLMTIRYTNQTYQEMQNYCVGTGKKGIKCAYGVPIPVSKCVVPDSVLMVMEMNNDTNQIVGVGLVRNTIQEPGSIGRKHFSIHDNGNLNRYVYLGTKHIRRDELTEHEEEVFAAFDRICFKGRKHLKRCVGITYFPLDITEACKELIDFPTFVFQMFKNRVKK